MEANNEPATTAWYPEESSTWGRKNQAKNTTTAGNGRTSPVPKRKVSAGVASVLKNAEENDEGAVLEQRDGNAGPTTCRQNYLVLGRLFKLHPDFDAAINMILAGDPGGCVVLIHETTDEELTRVVWDRLRGLLAPQGKCTYPMHCAQMRVCSVKNKILHMLGMRLHENVSSTVATTLTMESSIL